MSALVVSGAGSPKDSFCMGTGVGGALEEAMVCAGEAPWAG